MQYKYASSLILFCFLLPSILFGQIPKNVQSFDKLPRSIAKDYYIYRYLKERDISSIEAEKLLGESKRVTMRLFYLFAKKIDDPGMKKVSTCLKLNTKKLLKQDDECIAIGLTVKRAFALDKETLKKLSIQLKSYKKLDSTLKILSDDNVYEKALENKKKFLSIFNASGAKTRKNIFGKSIDKRLINQLSTYKNFNKTVNIIIMQNNLNNLQKSLLNVKDSDALKSKTLFMLALNALKQNKDTAALYFLKASDKKAKYRFDKDKILFWQYLITKDKKYTDLLMNSFDVNIYTIFAHEKNGVKFTNITSPQINKKPKKYNIENPFLWTKLLKKIKDKNSKILNKIADKFKHKNTIGQYTFIKERANAYKKQYFPMPFFNFLDNYNNKRRALILAIARQESRFIPASVSTSYALGMMQFMPFLARATAKRKKIKNFDLDDMFKPKIAYNFANFHLNYLDKHLHNPLFIAYAYNGGIGYTRRLLKSGKYFTQSKYEPYLSMELINYPQTRKYGKKVLANYIIYMQLLGEKISLNEIVSNTINFYDTMQLAKNKLKYSKE